MAIVKNELGNRQYVPSAYVKEELPTWNEVYRDYYQDIFLKGDHKFTMDDPGPDDKYWKFPHKKFIIAVVCNQFNKMIMTDSWLKGFVIGSINRLWFTSRFPSGSLAYDIRFGIQIDGDKTKLPEFRAFDNDTEPIIYTFDHPRGVANPFISSKRTSAERVNIASFESACIYPMIKISNDGKRGYEVYTPLPWTPDEEEMYKSIIELMMAPFREYFEGEGVGWKDADGHVISHDIRNYYMNTQSDPAL